MNVNDKEDFVFVCLLGAYILASLIVGPSQGRILFIHALPSLMALLKINLYDLHSLVLATLTRMKLLCRFRCFILHV